MSLEVKQHIQTALGVAIVFAGIWVLYTFYERHERDLETEKKNQPALLDPDYYVTPKKLHPYDLKSAHELTEQPVWVKVGYAYTCYPFNRASGHADFAREAGTLEPIERLQITDVVLDTTPRAPTVRQVMAVFKKDKRFYAFSIGSYENGSYHLYSDEMLFIEDPHRLYRHWPQSVWDAIGRHEVISGMNELQAAFAAGVGYPQGNSFGNRTVKYPNGGKPLLVTFQGGKATEISSGS